jgi:hypothetical protein
MTIIGEERNPSKKKQREEIKTNKKKTKRGGKIKIEKE